MEKLYTIIVVATGEEKDLPQEEAFDGVNALEFLFKNPGVDRAEFLEYNNPKEDTKE